MGNCVHTNSGISENQPNPCNANNSLPNKNTKVGSTRSPASYNLQCHRYERYLCEENWCVCAYKEKITSAWEEAKETVKPWIQYMTFNILSDNEKAWHCTCTDWFMQESVFLCFYGKLMDYALSNWWLDELNSDKYTKFRNNTSFIILAIFHSLIHFQ